MNKKNEKWLKDYADFLGSNADAPISISDKIKRNIHVLLNPNPWNIFAKLLGIHVIIGFLSLSICHQFGLNPFNTNRSLADWFMNVGGHNVCMVMCGLLFVSLSIFSAGVFLSIEEVKALRKTEAIQLLGLGIISLIVFLIFGAELTIGFAGLWLLGSFIGGVASTEVIFRLKLS